MNDWLHNLPVLWMALVIFGFTYLVSGMIYATVIVLAAGKRARSFKAVSPGMLPPLGIMFGLFVAFTAAQVWSDNDRASATVNREASALRAVVVLAASFPGEPEARLRGLVRRYIEEAATQEWPTMARRTATLRMTPRPLAEALELTLALAPSGQGQQIAQREIATALENVFDARRQRIISGSQVVKWSCHIPELCENGATAGFQPRARPDLAGGARAPLGELERAAWRHISIYAPCRCKHCTVIGNAGGP